MNRFFTAATALMLAGAAAPTVAQDPSASSGMLSSADVGVSPMMGVSATDYVKMAADSDMYEIQSSKLALSKSKRADVKAFAQQMITDHMQTSKSLMAALKNPDRTIAKPSMMLSSDNASKIALLKQAPKSSFDMLYLQQQVQAHQTAWALHKGYSTDGTDPALKQVASTALPIVEMHYQHVKSL